MKRLTEAELERLESLRFGKAAAIPLAKFDALLAMAREAILLREAMKIPASEVVFDELKRLVPTSLAIHCQEAMSAADKLWEEPQAPN